MKSTPAKDLLSKESLRRATELLWPPEASWGRVFAILDGARNPQIFGSVDAARVERTCLYSVNLRWPGEELPWKLIGVSPYLVELEKDSDLTPFVLSRGWHDHWGILFHSNAGFKELRRHFRELLVVNNHLRRRLMFRYYDPRVLPVYLASCRADELRAFFGPVEDFVVPGAERNTATRYRFDGTQLEHRTFDLQGIPRTEPFVNGAGG
jgi:hypothetical protein